MAEVKLIYIGSDGFETEMDVTTDTTTFGGLTMNGDIAMGSNKLTGLADGTAANDGVNKSQLDSAVINGGTVKELLLHEEQVSIDAQGFRASMALYMANNPVSGDTITITDGTTTRTYGAASGGDVQYTIGGTAADSMTNFAAAVAGDGSAVWDADFTVELDEINSAGVVVITDDDTTNVPSLSRIYGTFTTQADLQVIEYSDGTTVDNDYQNNTSATASTTDPTNSRFGVNKAAANLIDGEIHMVRNNDTLYSWDDSDNVWQVLSGAGSIPTATSGSGGATQGIMTADEDFGLLITAGVLTIDLATNPGLEFSSGDLQVQLDGDTIVTGASGISVDHSPQVKLDQLVTDANVTIGDPVYFSGNDTITGSDAANDTSTETFGVAEATVTSPTAVDVITMGEAAGALTGVTNGPATAGDVVYLGNGGGLDMNPPTGSGQRVVTMGVAMNASDLFVDIEKRGKLA